MIEAENPPETTNCDPLAAYFAALDALTGAQGEETADEDAAREGPGRVLPATAAGIGDVPRRLERGVAGREFLDLSKVRAAADQLKRLPGPGESFHCIMGGDFNGWDLVPAIHRLAGEPLVELWVATLGFNLANLTQLCQSIDRGDIGRRGGFLCSSFFAKSDRAVYADAVASLTARGWKVAHCRNHAKLLLLATEGARYVVESSANLRSCNNLEQFTLTSCPALYKFHRTWIERAIDAAAP